jgi:tripartite-type tricarboxylate transporter receptor subunit TctC
MNHRITCLAACLAAALAVPVAAQTYPAKPIRFVIGFTPGGGSDIVGRLVGQKMIESMGQQIIYDNRPGAGGNIAAELVTRAAPDGYTIYLAQIAAVAISPGLYAKLPYDPVKDFAPISLLATGPNVLAVHPTLPVRDVKGLVALARSRPGELSYASAGVGTVQHLAGESFNTMAKVRMVHVPYKGSAPALLDLMGGQTQLMFDALPPISGYLKQGKLRPVAVTSLARSALLPETPTIDESGLRGFDMTTWWGLLAPAQVPREVISRLNAEVAKAIVFPDVKERLAAVGAEPKATTPEAFGQFIRAEIEKWTKVIRAANVTPQ